MNRILVLRGGALGDFIVTLPALQLLRTAWPQAHVTLVGNATAGVLGGRAGTVDCVLSQHEARWAALHERSPLPEPLAAWLNAFDLVLNFWPDPDGAIAEHFPRRAGQRFLSAPAMPTVSPAARHYCEPLAALGLMTSDFRSCIPTPSVPRHDKVALHPGSGSTRKNWSLDRWKALCASLDAELVIVGGEAERVVVHTLAPRADVWCERPLLELADHLAQCRAFLGHDSGVSHLAAAVGTPCLLLFGPTDPVMWAPPGEHVHVLRRGDDLAALTVDDVLESTKRHFFAAQ